MSLSPVWTPARAVAVLLAFALLGTGVLAYTYEITRSRIEHNEELAKLSLLAQTLPRDLYDNNPVEDTITVPPDDLLGTSDALPAYIATKHGRATAVVLQAIAPDGYGGPIDLLVAVRADGEITGVRVVSEHETPGLGDYIEITRSPWITLFDKTSLSRIPDDGWRVQKDGGVFAYRTGATITPRAVVKAVHHALLYFREHRQALLAPPKRLEAAHERH